MSRRRTHDYCDKHGTDLFSGAVRCRRDRRTWCCPSQQHCLLRVPPWRSVYGGGHRHKHSAKEERGVNNVAEKDNTKCAGHDDSGQHQKTNQFRACRNSHASSFETCLEGGRMTIATSTELICFLVLSAVVVTGALGVVLLSNIVYSAFLLGGVFMAVAGLYLLLNASFVAAAQVMIYVGAINVLILFAIMLVNKREDLKAIANLTTRRIVSGGVCLGLLALLVRVVVTTPWSLPGPAAVGEEATARIGEHLFTDYLLPFELASVLLLMAMIGAIVLARRDVLANDVVTGEAADQGLIEKARTPLLLERRSS